MSSGPVGPDRYVRAVTRSADERLLRGYGPLLGFIVLFLAMALAAPSISPEQRVTNTAGGQQVAPGAGSIPSNPTGRGGSSGSVPGSVSSRSPASTAPTTTTGGGLASGRSCAGVQVPGDPYAPPCVSWSGGNNGGATAPGVTANAINVTYREAGLPDVGSLIAQFTGNKQFISSQTQLIATIKGLIKYFNTHYQFYGRKLNLKIFQGQGDELTELTGGGQAGAEADAINAEQQQHAFANLLATSYPYSDALAAHHVIALDNAGMSNEFGASRYPYAWNSYYPSCTPNAQATAAFLVKEIIGKPAAYAGGSLQGKPRKIGIVDDDNAELKPCLGIVEAALKRAGVNAEVKTLTFDLGTIQQSTQQIIGSFQNDGVTSVVLLCDAATPIFLTDAASSANYYPEWILTGQPYIDEDFFAQIVAQDEWAHAFGITYTGREVPPRASAGYYAFEQADPGAQPDVLLVQQLYEELRMLSIGIQLAGPDLTPQSFAAGLRSYGPHTGPDGEWAFPNGEYNATRNFRLVWYDAKATSPTNGQPGAYFDNGKRYTATSLPTGNPPVFLNGKP